MSKQLTAKKREILHSDFPKEKVFDRETIEKYSKNIRGSVRLANNMYYTQKEMEKKGKELFSTKLY